MKRKNTLAALLAMTLLSTTTMPAVYAAQEPNPAGISNANAISSERSLAANYSVQDVNDKLDHLKDLIDKLDGLGDLTDAQTGWLKQLKDAYDFLKKVANGQLGSLKDLRAKFIPRIDLLINVAEVITTDATEFADSEQEAHVIVGFAVTRAILKATDLFQGPESLKQASTDLMAALEKAKAVPKQTDDSVRTHYNLQALNKALVNAKRARNQEFRYKLDPVELEKVDTAIKNAENVKRNGRATVGQVKAATEELNKTVEEAYKTIDAGDLTASKAQRDGLGQTIQAAKNLRDGKLKGNVDASVIKELNKAIADANHVRVNGKTTATQVEEAKASLLEAMKTAEEALNTEEPVEDAPVVEDETLPDQEQPVEEPDQEQPVEEPAPQEEQAPQEDQVLEPAAILAE